MPDYQVEKPKKRQKAGKKDVLLVASGDLRISANQNCWAAQQEMERLLTAAIEKQGYQVTRKHAYDKKQGHGFIASQAEGMRVFSDIDPDAKLIVAEAVWQYSHHLLPGLLTHRGPILTRAFRPDSSRIGAHSRSTVSMDNGCSASRSSL